jgi:hypothetical protein
MTPAPLTLADLEGMLADARRTGRVDDTTPIRMIGSDGNLRPLTDLKMAGPGGLSRRSLALK